MRLLIADSDPTLTDIYESFFSGEGYEVVTVGDGQQCLKPNEATCAAGQGGL